MKITTLEIENYRGTAGRVTRLAPVTVITGPNGSGKTTLQDALEQLASGRCQHTDENGSGARLVRDGARTCAITVMLPDGTRATRSYPPNALSLSWKPGANLTEAQAALNEAMGCSGDQARLSLRTGRFFGLHAKDRNKMLTALMALEPEPERMAAELEGLRGKGLAIDAALKAAEVKGTASLDRIQKATYARRTSCKAELARAKVEAERLDAAFQQLDDEPNPPSLRELSDAKAAVQNATLALGRAQADAKRVAVLEEQLAGLEQAAKLAGDMAAKLPAMLEREARIRPRLAELREQVRKLEGQLPELGAARKRLAVVEAALAEDGTCPTCGGPVRDRGKLEGEAAELGATIDTLAAVPGQLQETRAKLASGEAALAELLPQIAEAQKLTSQAERVEQARAELGRLRAQAQDPTALEADLAAAREAEAAVVDRQQAHADFLAAEKAAKEAAAKLAALTTEREALEALVAWSGPKGLRARLLAERIGPFEDALGGILELFGLRGQHVEAKEGLQLEVARAGDSAWVPWEELSDSEQLRVGFAYVVAFAVYSGLRIAVLDRIEALDAEGQQALFDAALLASRSGWCDHILLLGVDVRCPVPEGVELVQLEREVARVA